MASSRHAGHAGPYLSGRCASARHQGERTSTSRQTCCPSRFPRCAGSSGVSSGQGRPIPVASSLGRTGDDDTSSVLDDHTGPAEPELINPGCSTRACSTLNLRTGIAFCPSWNEERAMLTDAHWMRLEPLIEACRPKGKTPPQDLRRTISAIRWRHENGAKWRAIPAELGPWSRAAQMFIRWAHLGVWERLLLLAQERGVQLGMTFLDGTSIRAHHKAAGAEKRGPPARVEMSVRRWAARGAATAPRRV